MTALRKLAWALLATGAAIGTILDSAPARPPLTIEGYRVLAADLHVHPHPLSGATLAPWDLVVEARHQALDVLAVTPHNGALAGKVARWFAARFGGPTVIPGEEIHGPRYHMIALDTFRYIDWRLSPSDAIDEIHRQGGVAIAAHPVGEAWAVYGAAALHNLDGAEVVQPIIYQADGNSDQLRNFWQRSGAAAIGSSDYHGMGPLGFCRTYLFTHGNSPADVLEAIRARRTVVLDGARAYGDPALVKYAPQLPRPPARPSPIGGALAVAGLAALIVTKS